MWIMPLSVLCHWTLIVNGSIFNVMFLYGFMWDCGDMFSGGVGITIDFTLMILFFTSICIEGRSVLWSSITIILLTVVILWMLIKWYMSLSMIIFGDNSCFPWKPITLLIFSLERCDWLSTKIQETFYQ